MSNAGKKAEKKFGFYLVGRKIKHFFAAAFGNGGTSSTRYFSAGRDSSGYRAEDFD
jgi:hypothetical protein